MKIIFFGTGEFALTVLKRLAESCHDLAAVVTQPDKERGRGCNVLPQRIKAFIEKAAPGVSVFQPEKVSDEMFLEDLKKLNADVFVVVDYGQILSEEVLALPKRYCINLHPSLLPKYRGAAPINRAILNGENRTGSTVIVMNERMDAGDIILQSETKIGKDDDAVSLRDKLSSRGAELLVEALEKIASGEENRRAQDDNEATYAPKLRKEEGKIDWTNSAEEILRKMRGLKPWPGTFTYLDGKVLKITEASIGEAKDQSASPGEVAEGKEICVSAGKGSLIITKLQLAGRKVMTHKEFLRGYKFKDSTVLGKN